MCRQANLVWNFVEKKLRAFDKIHSRSLKNFDEQFNIDSKSWWKLQYNMVKHELRVERLKARAESLKTWVKIQKWGFKYRSYEFKSTSYEVQIHELRV